MTAQRETSQRPRCATLRRALLLVEALVLAGSVPAAASTQQQATASPSLVFDGVTVVDVEQGKLVPDQRVVITGNRIQAVGNTGQVKLPPDAKVVAAQGKYLIPGLWDMHTHVAGARRDYSLLVANGVTGIREMSTAWPQGFDTIREQRREIANGTLVGPRIIATSYDFYGPICTAAGGGILALMAGMMPADSKGCKRPNDHTVTTPDEVRRIVDTLKAVGADFVKAHGVSDPEVYFALLAEARRVGIPAVGHLTGPDGRAATAIEASDSGLRSAEHINEIDCWQVDGGSGKLLPDSIAEQQCAAVAERFSRNGTWMVPTLYVQSADEYKRAVGILHRFGAPMLAGSDGSARMPKSSLHPLHEELALLVDAGLTPLEALRAATLNPAKFINATDSLGTIASGKVADCVLLDADPLADIRNVTTIRAVVANGRYFDRAALDTLVTPR